jgi:cell division protein FtsQ
MPAAPAQGGSRTTNQKKRSVGKPRAGEAAPKTEVIPRQAVERGAGRGGARRGKAGDDKAPRAGRPAASSAMTRRLAERRAMHRHRVWRAVALWAAAAAVAAALVWVAFFSTVLALETHRVEVSGQGTTIDVAQVRQQVAPHAGVPLPRLDTVALRQRILGLNGVKDVRLSRAWPHGLVVDLVSREPAAAIPVDGRVALVDVEGVRVGTAGRAPRGLPVVEVGLEPKDAPALQAALHVLAGLPPGFSKNVTHVSADTRDDVRTTFASGQVVHWGSDARVAYKVKVVRALRKADPDAGVYDVSSPDLPVSR